MNSDNDDASIQQVVVANNTIKEEEEPQSKHDKDKDDSDSEYTDHDTLGLHYYDEANKGGVLPNATASIGGVSALTTPTTVPFQLGWYDDPVDRGEEEEEANNNSNDNNNNSAPASTTTFHVAMIESLRSLPGAFRVTPSNFNSNENDAEWGEEQEEESHQESNNTHLPVLPEHDIAVEAYAVNDDGNDNNRGGNQRIAANNNQGGEDNDVEYGQQRQQPTTNSNSSSSSNNNDIIPIAQVVPTIFGIDKRRFKQITLLLGVVLIAVIVVLSVVLTNNNNKSNNNNDVGTTNEDDNYDDQSTINERRQKLIKTISPLVREGTFDQLLFGNYNNPTGNQYIPTGIRYIDDRVATLEWLVQHSSSEELLIRPNWRVQQRYVLALLYISTTSNNNIIGTQWGGRSSTSTTNDSEEEEEDEEDDDEMNNNNDWYQKLNFLSNKDECEWYTSRTICNTYPNINPNPNLEDCPTEYLENNVETKGVVCDDEGRVTRISLYENNLIGSLPPELSVLSEINTLYFVTNKISGNIPSSFGNMTKLSSLLLGNNCLEGSIPSELFDLNLLGLSNYHLNSKLTGSLDGFCGLEGPREGVNFIAADCGSCPYALNVDPATLDLFAPAEPNTVVELTTGVGNNYTASTAVFNVECDCCTCCDPISEMCCNSDGSFAFPAGVEATECSL